MDCPSRPDCKYFNTELGCHTDRHHIWNPASEYKTRIEKKFRALPFNVIELCRVEHETLHLAPPPPKPPRSFMLSEIERNG